MLNNYEAIVRAVLDKTKFDSDMGELVKKQYTLSGIKLDSKGISAEIQKALSSASFDIHINPAVDTKEAQEIGRSYGKNLLSGITSGIGKGGIDLYGSLLGNNGAGKANANQIINGLVKMLESVNVQARSVKTELGDMTNAAKGLRNIKVSGVDETGALLTNVIKLNQETGEVASNITTVTKKFDTNTKATREANEAYRELLNIQSRLNSLNANVLKLDVGKNSKEIAELNGQIETLTERYRKLRLYFNDDLSVEQLTNLDRAINMSADSLLLLQARIADTGNLNRITTEYKELYDTAKKISSLELKIAGLDSENDINQIRVLESQISDLEVTYGNLVTSLNGRLPTEQWQKINDVFSETVRKLDLIEAQAKDADKVVSNLQVITLDNKMANWLENNSKASRMFGSSIEDLRKQLRELNSSGNLTEKQLKELEEQFKDVQQQAIAAGKTGKSFGTTFSNAFESIAKYISVATIMDAAVDSLRDMYDAVYDVDTAMTELVKVTTATEQTYSKFIKTASSASKDIGTTVSEYINSTADFARLGHSLAESQELAKVANIYNVVGDDIESIDQATSSIISTMTAFGIATNNAMQIVDKFNKVSNEFPISSGGIGEALTKSASSMAAANNTLDQTIALITAANAVTQDPDAVGKQTMPTIKITISVKNQRWSRPRKDFVDIVTRQLGRACFYYLRKGGIVVPKECTHLISVICENCGKITTHTRTQYNRAKHHYCSNKCQKEFQHKLTHEQRKCQVCGNMFEVSKRSTKTFCSVSCQHEWQHSQTGEKNPRYKRQKVVCEFCGKEFVVKKYKTKNGSHLFCSNDCRRKWYSKVWSQDEDWKNRSRLRAVKMLENGQINTDTKPQRLVNSILEKMKVSYVNEKSYGYYAVDNYLPEFNLIIEVMGDFWHCNPCKYPDVTKPIQIKRIPKDKAKHTFIRNQYNIEILYLWEDDINNRPYLCRRLISQFIRTNGQLQNYHSFNYHIRNNRLLLNDNLIIPYQDR